MLLKNDGVDGPGATKPRNTKQHQAQANLDIFGKPLALKVANPNKDFISFNSKHTGDFK